MANQQVAHIRVKEPRKLESKESMQSLQQWKTQFKQFVKRDDHFKTFIASDISWDPNVDNYGFVTETDGLRRSARAMMDDCVDFLHILANFLPHGYLTEKIVTATTSFVNAYEVIQEHYGLLPSQESFLELWSFQKQPGESYRQFYERLLAHIRQHLQNVAGVRVDGVVVPTGGDKLTVSHTNLVALIWLQKIHPELLNIIRTEYSLELRENKPLSSLVPRISVNIDNLLSKYDKVGAVQRLQLEEGSSRQSVVARTYIKRNNERKPKSPFCPGCYGVSKKTGNQIHFKHNPIECPRQAMIKMLQTNDNYEEDNDNITTEEEGNVNLSNTVCNFNDQQVMTYSSTTSDPKCFSISTEQNADMIEAFIFTLDSRIKQFRKEISPTLNCLINNTAALCIVDEGSEINCCSYLFAKKAKIPIKEVQCSAVGANKSKMNVIGMAKTDIYATVIGSRNAQQIKLAEMIVINNLGADILLGQPCKVDNQIITLPHKGQIQFKSTDGSSNKIHYPLRKDENLNIKDVIRVDKSQTIFPLEAFSFQLPNKFILQKKVCITERPNNLTWIGTRILDVKDGIINIVNNTNHPVYLNKYQHIADVSNVERIKVDDSFVVNQVPVVKKDLEHLEPYADWNYDEDFVKDVKIDPDNMMDEYWKDKFRELCQEYSDIINYRPSKYNGYYGDVDNTIEFASVPPPTNKIHMPKYSEQMNLILAEKMDQLERWHVLTKPEKVNVKPKFVCPSLLVPKDDTQEWRLITNFTPLNKYIKKPPTVSPTIQETKMQLAKYKYIATLDLANFYYQHGVTKTDMQYLATHHPYKGLLLYTCEPQGLRGVSEHSYERLSRVYGELCQQNKMARQADGLFVGGRTLQELYDNLTEVFNRTRNCGFTLKPSKIIINPKTVILFGWIRDNGAWRPTEHTMTPLAKANKPTTI